MLNLKEKFKRVKKTHLKVAGILILILLAVSLLWYNNSTSKQSVSTTAAQVCFDGEYRIAGGEWQPIQQGEHIPASKGDVTLKINFSLANPDGTPMNRVTTAPIAFYTNHIGLTFYENGVKVRSVDNEHPMIGESACAESWYSHNVKIGSDSVFEIVVHNPHSFGNETAIDDMLSSFGIWSGVNYEMDKGFEKSVLERGEIQRSAGIFLMIVSLVFLGTALFSTLIHIKKSKIIWILGLVVLFAGVYFVYDSTGISFFSESTASNTTFLGCSMMLYMLFLLMSISCFLKVTGIAVGIALFVLSAADAVLFVLPIVTDVYFYDVWLWWVIIQLVANAALIACLIKEILNAKNGERWIFIGALLPLLAFAFDVLGVWLGIWSGGAVSKCVFIVLFAVSTITVLRFIPNSINAATKAKELEMEKIVLGAALAESRISTMMSQIRPHFIYNTLGSIEQLCKLDPPKAGELVHNFAKYLRGNFGELDNPKPILMSQEMEHVHHYISIENVRFPDMTFTFEMNSSDFKIPALTVQPIVENAIKHGLMKLSKGGTIRVVSYETESDFCISVVDDGVGFDTGTLLDERGHVGIRNIRERLKVMVSGRLDIESTPGVGTKVLITIPKEAHQ